MELDLAGRIAIVTGASKGIGLAIARGLVASGAHVVAGARASSAELEELAQSGQAQIALVDLAGAEGPAALVAQAGDQIDILINNVGSAPARTGGFLSISDADWHATLEINLMAAVRATRSALPAMIAAGKGAIVSTCSANAHLPDPAVMDYSAAKAALASFSKALSKEVGPHGIRVNTVSPGPVATDLWLGHGGVAATVSAATGADPKAVARQAASQMVTGRFTRPEEVANLVIYLASDLAANITGTDFAIDGGLIPTL
jgi:NAD(P)-dependent dehydrogenase (short-subunit alcohol dehydrogenase family)